MKETKFDLFATHDGWFHADDRMAKAYVIHAGLVEKGNCIHFPVNEPDQRLLSDPSVIVVDMWRQNDSEKHNFDHHQDKELPCALMMVFRAFPLTLSAGLIELFHYIDQIDRGHIQDPKITDIESLTFTQCVRLLNSAVNGADIVDELCLATLKMGYFRLSHTPLFVQSGIKEGFDIFQAALAEAAQRWEALDKIGRVAICEVVDTPANWREMALESGIDFLISPSARGGWNLTSRDSETCPIPANTNQSFLHASKFLAVYPDRKTALDHACSLNTQK